MGVFCNNTVCCHHYLICEICELLRTDNLCRQIKIIREYFRTKWSWILLIIYQFLTEGISFTDSSILFQGIEEAAAVVLLPRLLREKGGSTEDLIKMICTVWLIPCIIENINIHVTYKAQLYKVLSILILGLA